ncbi:hypothetical protein AB0A63_30960 [Lentzea sp. NPDC042327]|uniref:hypothetical protein n=1 Tax=Lentzea sp. NPDC042327 TaxID=3154801 RepID=UPI0033DC6FFC
MSATATVEHLASVSPATDDSDDMKIYQFDREASMDIIIWSCCSSGTCVVGSQYTAYDEVLAA